MAAYYNEINKHAAQWLRNLIAAGHIAPGDVDERSIEDVRPSDLIGYTQCHFFAGVGIWSLAFRRAGWPDDRPVWSGSCPCQPFSAAGQGTGFDDERHLWPAFHHLIKERRPAKVVGEQVASKDADPWIDLVHTDMEALGYAFGAVAFPSAGVGAPHIRDRTYWVADADHKGLERRKFSGERAIKRLIRESGLAGGMVNPASIGQSWGIVSDGNHETSEGREAAFRGEHREQVAQRGPVGGFWSNAEWIACFDDRARPVEPGTFPLAHGAAERVGRLRAYGNAINAEAATEFIKACFPI